MWLREKLLEAEVRHNNNNSNNNATDIKCSEKVT